MLKNFYDCDYIFAGGGKKRLIHPMNIIKSNNQAKPCGNILSIEMEAAFTISFYIFAC